MKYGTDVDGIIFAIVALVFIVIGVFNLVTEWREISRPGNGSPGR